MKHIKFTVQMDDRIGDYGALPNIFRNWDSYIASWSLGHDLIEHSTKSGQETGEVWQELRALGAHLFTSNFGYSVESNYWNTPQKKGESLSSDLDSILNDQEGNWSTLPKAPRIKLDEGEEENFTEVWKSFKHHVRNYREYNEDVLRFYWENKGEILAWLRYGFYLAKKRYKGDEWNAWQMRKMIDRTLSEFGRKLNSDFESIEQFEGEEFTLSYSVENMHCEITSSNRYSEFYRG